MEMMNARVLIIEEDRSLGEEMAKEVKLLGYQVACVAAPTDQVLAMVSEIAPDLILLSIENQSIVEGIETGKLLRNKFDIPIIYLTDLADTGFLKRAQLTEPYGCLIKPCSPEQLRACAHMALYKHRMESRIREAEARYRCLFGEAPISMWEEDFSALKEHLNALSRSGITNMREYLSERPDLLFALAGLVKVTDVNRATLRMFGAADQQALSGKFHLIFSEASLPALRESTIAVHQGKTQFEAETVNLTLSGEERRILVKWSVPPDIEKPYSRVLVSLIDITRQKRAEEALQKMNEELEMRVRKRTTELETATEQLRREIEQRRTAEEEHRQSEQILSTVFESAHDAIFVKDALLRYKHVNPAMSEILGKPEKEVVGCIESDLLPETEATTTARLESRVLSGEVVETQRTRVIGGQDIRFHELRVPVRDENGQIKGVCGIFREVADVWRLSKDTRIQGVHGKSEATKAVLNHALAAANTRSTILLTGETGCGKDYLARLIHSSSRHSKGPFFSINCATLPSNLVEGELFGYEAGAFTGAARLKKGLLELAQLGTILLNEIGEVSLPVQSKLLMFLDTHSFCRLGGVKPIEVDARIIAATNRDLSKDVSEGRFRADLYYRLNVLHIHLPPLRERTEDIPSLARDLLTALAPKFGLSRPPELDEKFLEALKRYHWPGNVRELRNVLERWLIAGGRVGEVLGDFENRVNTHWAVRLPFPERTSLHGVLMEAKRALVEEAIRRAGGNKKAAAGLLGISYQSMRHIMRTLDAQAAKSKQ